MSESTQLSVAPNPAARATSGSLFAGGIFAILVGVLALAWPGLTLGVIAVTWGIFAIADGITSFTRLSGASTGEKALYIASGIIGVLAGIAILLQPLWGAAVLTWVLGFWMIVRGIIEIIAAFRLPKDAPKGWLITAGVLWIIGGIIVTAHPGSAMLGIVFWLALLSIGWGVTFIVAGFSARKAAKNISA